MNERLKTLFTDNPYMAEQLCAFCDSISGFQAAEREYYAMENELCRRLGYEAFSAFEQVQSTYIAELAHAYYLFGLGLRQEVLYALTRE